MQPLDEQKKILQQQKQHATVVDKLNNPNTLKLLALLNQTRLYKLQLQLYECDKTTQTPTHNTAFTLEILNTTKKYLAIATHHKYPIQLNNTYTHTKLETITQKFIENNYKLYYTNQQLVADFLDEHFDTSNTNTIKTTDNIIHTHNITLNTIIEKEYKKLIKKEKITNTIDYLNTNRNRKLKIIYIQLLKK